MHEIKKIKKILVANRGEIAIRIFRACNELDINTVAIYSEQDETSLHRYKADEAYLIGEGKDPIAAYLSINEIIEIAKRNNVDAIHPGYGFLAENAEFAERCTQEGIIFIGPASLQIKMFGDKITARQIAQEAGIPIIPGTNEPIKSYQEALSFAQVHGFPLIIKAQAGGGGRGMRIVQTFEQLNEALDRARSEAGTSFGNSEVYLEKYLENPKHIEVQILGDKYGNIVHLYERDCSIQRRHQKLVEVAPSLSLSEELRQKIAEAAVTLMKHVRYYNAGTVEFLLTPDQKFYFIEVNPRIQVEHTITELITGIDIVQTQIKIAEGYPLASEEIGIFAQEKVEKKGYAIQCRITTEDPENNFLPDTGKIIAYRSASGFGVRLDGGNGFAGSYITPYYDSLLVKVSTYAPTFRQAAKKMLRTLQEFRIRGVKTNILFLKNVINHPKFLNGEYNTSFIEQHSELFVFPARKDRGTKLLTYIADVTINGYPNLPKGEKKLFFPQARVPKLSINSSYPAGTRNILNQRGAEGLIKWIKEQKKVLITDTTMRDAHQSLLATRIRTYDLIKIAESYGKLSPELFSLEMWGGATFDTSMRFLKESPWVRLEKLRSLIPNILFQMLIRGANAVGYSNYPDNVIKAFIKEAALTGIDIFRIFDSLNWLENMKLSIDAVREQGKIAEAAICYTGDILDPAKEKYNLKYYIKMAKELEKAGANIIGIKDMAGILKPYAAYKLIKTLKEEIGLPIHLHTHDTSGNGLTTLLKAVEAGVDIVDTALSSMSGLTSQPSLNSLVAALELTEDETGLKLDNLQLLSNYWEDVRTYYYAFESNLKASSVEVYKHEMPGGQYSNLEQQAKSLGLEERFNEVIEMYGLVNKMFGDIVKVTPSSKVVGDMALFMVQNNLREEDIYNKGDQINFPDSVVQFFQGYLGQPYGGFPAQLQKIILKGIDYITVRPGELLAPVDFPQVKKELEEKLRKEITEKELLSYIMYPQVFLDYANYLNEYTDLSVLDSPTFFYGLRLGEKIAVEIEKGKTLIIKLISIGALQADGLRQINFELNGTPREILIRDNAAKITTTKRKKAEKTNPKHLAATMPGKVLKIMVSKGEKVKKGEYILVIEAMKMETTIQASFSATVKELYVKEGDIVETNDLLIEFV